MQSIKAGIYHRTAYLNLKKLSKPKSVTVASEPAEVNHDKVEFDKNGLLTIYDITEHQEEFELDPFLAGLTVFGTAYLCYLQFNK